MLGLRQCESVVVLGRLWLRVLLECFSAQSWHISKQAQPDLSLRLTDIPAEQSWPRVCGIIPKKSTKHVVKRCQRETELKHTE